MVTRKLNEDYWSKFENDLQVFLDNGIRCLSGSFKLIFIVIRTVIITQLKIYQVIYKSDFYKKNLIKIQIFVKKFEF